MLAFPKCPGSAIPLAGVACSPWGTMLSHDTIMPSGWSYFLCRFQHRFQIAVSKPPTARKTFAAALQLSDTQQPASVKVGASWTTSCCFCYAAANTTGVEDRQGWPPNGGPYACLQLKAAAPSPAPAQLPSYDCQGCPSNPFQPLRMRSAPITVPPQPPFQYCPSNLPTVPTQATGTWL